MKGCIMKVKFKFSANGEVNCGEFVRDVKDSENNISGVDVIIDDNCIHFVPNDLIVEVINE